MTQIDRTEGLVGNTAIKAPVRAATTAAITLTGEQTIDGVAVVTGDRVLVKNQASSVDNGIYDADTGAWTRSQDADGSYDIVKGTLVVVTDGTTNGATIWRQATANDITIGTSALVFQNAVFSDSQTVSFTQAGTGAVQRTSQSKMRDVVSVMDFGAVGDQSTDDSSAVQAAIDAIRTLNHGTIFFPNCAGYKLNSALDVTGEAGIRFVAEGGNNASYANIYPYHTGHVFDCSDSSFLTFENIAIRTYDNVTKPKTGWFLARNAAKASAGNHQFIRCASYGKFSESVVYSYGSESNEFYHCYLANQETSAAVLISTANNINALSSTFITIATGSCSNIVMNIFGGSMAMLAGSGDAVYLDDSSLFSMYATELFSSDGSATRGNSLIYVDCVNGASDYLRLHNVTGENFGGALNPDYGIYINAGASPVSCTSWDITNFRHAAFTNTIYGEATVTISGFNFNGISNVDASATGLSLDYAEYGYLFNVGKATFRTSVIYTELHGALSAFTLPATRTGTVVFDTLTGSIDRLRGVTLTIPTNPPDVSVPDSTATTLFDIRTYCGGGQDMEFTFSDDATILGRGWVGRPNSGALLANLRSGGSGSGVALSISGNNVQLTHTVGTTRTIKLRLFPASAAVA